MDNSPQNKKPNATANASSPRIAGTPVSQSNSDNVAFKSDYIGQWAAKQDDPFAEQNRKAAEKKAAQEAARKKALPYIKIGSIVAGCLAALAVIITVIVIVTKPTPITELTPEESTSIQDEAQKIFDKHTQNINLDDTANLTDKEKEDVQKAIEEVGKYYEQQSERIENDNLRVPFVMDEMMFYLWNNQPEAALKASRKINIDAMSMEEKISYYSLMGNIYDGFENSVQAEYYYNLMREASGDTYVEG